MVKGRVSERVIFKLKPGYEKEGGIKIMKIYKLSIGNRNRKKRRKAITKCKRPVMDMGMVMTEGEIEDQNMWSMANEGEMAQVGGVGGDDKVKQVG